MNLSDVAETDRETWRLYAVATGVGRIEVSLAAAAMRVAGNQADHGEIGAYLFDVAPQRRRDGIAEAVLQLSNEFQAR